MFEAGGAAVVGEPPPRPARVAQLRVGCVRVIRRPVVPVLGAPRPIDGFFHLIYAASNVKHAQLFESILT